MYTRTPTELRRLARHNVVADPECYLFRLAYRPPYDWDAVLDFLRARATPGVESVEGCHYRRTIQVDGKSGVIDVSRLDAVPALQLNVRFPDPQALLPSGDLVLRRAAGGCTARELDRTSQAWRPVLEPA